MLGKLLKHEFRATGRTMLPVLAVLSAVVLVTNLFVRFGDQLISRYRLAAVLFALIVAAAVIGVIAAEVMAIVVMVQRFYKNLLGDEGYLMHTLPVNVHELVWSKLIVSLVWILATNLVIFLLGLASVVNLADLSVGQIMAGFPSVEEIRRAMAELGITRMDLWLLILEVILMVLCGGLITCLHFYAAMSLGHIFTQNKVLMSVVFFIGINFLFNALSGILGTVSIQLNAESFMEFTTALDGLRQMQAVLGSVLGYSLVQGTILYIATTLGLQKGLNLA